MVSAERDAGKRAAPRGLMPNPVRDRGGGPARSRTGRFPSRSKRGEQPRRIRAGPRRRGRSPGRRAARRANEKKRCLIASQPADTDHDEYAQDIHRPPLEATPSPVRPRGNPTVVPRRDPAGPARCDSRRGPGPPYLRLRERELGVGQLEDRPDADVEPNPGRAGSFPGTTRSARAPPGCAPGRPRRAISACSRFWMSVSFRDLDGGRWRRREWPSLRRTPRSDCHRPKMFQVTARPSDQLGFSSSCDPP